MDEEHWSIEFKLRSSMEDHHSPNINLNLIADPRLKKTILLRAIQMEALQASVTETLLLFFEIIELLDAKEGLSMTAESMKAAYCAVALECTLKYLAAGPANGRYYDAFRRIWRGRVAALGRSRLVSRELEEWKREVEAALLDKSVAKKLVNLNTRNEALKLIGDYLVEAWGALGSSFVELSALLMENGMVDDMHSATFEQAIDRIDIVSVDVGGRGGGKIVLPSQMENYLRLVCQGSVPVLTQAQAKRDDRLNVNWESGVNDGSKQPIFAAMNTERVQAATKGHEVVEEEVAVLHDPSSRQCKTDMHIHSGIVSEDVGKSGGGNIELPSQVKSYSRPEHQGSVPVLSQAEAMINDWLNVVRNSGVNHGSKQSAFVAMNTESVQESATKVVEGQESVEEEVAVLHNSSPSGRENLKTSVLPRSQPLALHKRVREVAKISHLDDLDDDNLSRKYTCLQTPDVERVREALKTSSLELQTLVKDPLPDALCIAESVAQDLAEKNKTSEHYVEDQNDVGAANSPVNKDDHDVPVQSVNTDPKNPSHDHHTTDPRPSIMECNSTVCIDKRNNSIHGSPGENHVSRLHLPSPKRKVISPVKKYEETKMVRRRKCRRWSLLEEDTLRTAVQRFGKGNWKLILHSYRDIFDERTEVDLKDKWRNMTR